MSHLSDVAQTLSPGQWGLLCQQGDGSNYGNPVWPTDLVTATGAGFRIYEYAYNLGYDPHRQRCFYAGGAHVAGNEGNFLAHYGFIGYDIASNRWAKLPNPPHIADTTGNPHPYGFNYFLASERKLTHSAANSGRYYLCNTDVDAITDIGVGNWAEGPFTAAFDGTNGRGFHIAFPERDSIIRFIPYAPVLQEMKHTASNWTTLAFAPSPNYLVEGPGAAYSPVHKKVLWGGGYDGTFNTDRRFWIMAENGTITATQTLPNDGSTCFFSRDALLWADPATGDFLVLTINATHTAYFFYRYDVGLNAWARLSSLEANVPIGLGAANYDLFCSVVAPLRDLGVTIVVGPKVYIYKHAANTDAVSLTHARKTTQAGVIASYGFDAASNVRNYPTAAYPLKYTNAVGACTVLGTNYPYDPAVRGAGEANAKANDYTTFCAYPRVDLAIYNAAGGGSGSLKIDIPTNSPDGVGGYFDTPYQGTDNAILNLAPHNFGRVWYQLMLRTENVDAANLEPSIAAGTGYGPKLVIGASRPPYLVGSDVQSSHDILLNLKRNGIFEGYTYSATAVLKNFDRTVGGHLYLQNVALCEYTGGVAATYTSPPCALAPDDGSWQQLTWYFELRPAATNCAISGTTLTKTGFFTFPGTQYQNRWIYIQPDGVAAGAYHTIVSKISNDALQLSGSPPAGSGKSIVISDYPNSIVDFWINGQKIIALTDQVIFWDGSDIATQNPAGFASFRIAPQMTGKDPAIAHLAAALWYDDLIISTEPIRLGAGAAATDLPAAPALPWFLRT